MPPVDGEEVMVATVALHVTKKYRRPDQLIHNLMVTLLQAGYTEILLDDRGGVWTVTAEMEVDVLTPEYEDEEYVQPGDGTPPVQGLGITELVNDVTRRAQMTPMPDPYEAARKSKRAPGGIGAITHEHGA